MSETTWKDPTWYQNGTGYTGKTQNRIGYYYYNSILIKDIIRYTFETGNYKITQISIKHTGLQLNSSFSDKNGKIKFFITESSNSHQQAVYYASKTDANNVLYDGTLTINNYTGTGTITKELKPNTTYYLYLFPSVPSNDGKFLYYVNSTEVILTLEEKLSDFKIKINGQLVDVYPMIKQNGKLVDLTTIISS